MAESAFKDRLRVVPEFRADEHEKYADVLFGRLERRLQRWDPASVELELSVKERDSDSQRVTLECWVPGLPKIVGTSSDPDLDRAVVEVRDEVWRQIDRQVNRRQTTRRG
ncbi:MAG: HPF/RaiA family ribosome-associated protein [Actinomycetota bacterium]